MFLISTDIITACGIRIANAFNIGSALHGCIKCVLDDCLNGYDRHKGIIEMNYMNRNKWKEK